MMVVGRITLPEDELAAFCRQHGIRRLAIFGSALRDDFRVVDCHEDGSGQCGTAKQGKPRTDPNHERHEQRAERQRGNKPGPKWQRCSHFGQGMRSTWDSGS